MSRGRDASDNSLHSLFEGGPVGPKGGPEVLPVSRYGLSGGRQRRKNLSLHVLNTVSVLSSLTFEPLTELSSVLRNPVSPVLKGPGLGLSFGPVKIGLQGSNRIGDLEIAWVA